MGLCLLAALAACQSRGSCSRRSFCLCMHLRCRDLATGREHLCGVMHVRTSRHSVAAAEVPPRLVQASIGHVPVRLAARGPPQNLFRVAPERPCHWPAGAAIDRHFPLLGRRRARAKLFAAKTFRTRLRAALARSRRRRCCSCLCCKKKKKKKKVLALIPLL